MRDWWDSLSGATKGWVEALVAAIVTGGADVAIQELSAPGLVLDYKQIAAAAGLAGLVYVRAHLSGLLRYPDGSTVHVQPHG